MICHNRNDNGCRWHRRKEARPEEILDAALSLFVEKGFSATRMTDVAKQANISKGTLYNYFESKESIFREVVQSIISPMIDEAENVINQHTGSTEELIRMMMLNWFYSLHGSAIAGVPKLIISESGNFPELAQFYTDKVIKRVRKLFENMIQQGIENNEFKACDIKTMTRLLMAPIIQSNIWFHSFKDYDDQQDDEAFIKLHLDLFMRGLKQGSAT